MKKSISVWLKTTYVVVFISFLICLSYSCTQQVEEGITEEEAAALIEKDQEIYNEGNLALIEELISPDYVQHSTSSESAGEEAEGIEGFRNYITTLRTAYPDFNYSVEEFIVKDDNIVVRWIVNGTNTGVSASGLPPTGQKIQFEGAGIVRVTDGKIVERIVYYNQATALVQLGYTITPPEVESEQ